MPVSKEEYMRVGAVKTACADGVDDIRLILAHRELISSTQAMTHWKWAHPRAQGAYVAADLIDGDKAWLILAHRELILV